MNTNALLMQSGGPTPVLNRSLFGLVDEVRTRPTFARILGADHGIEGILTGDLLDLGRTSASQWSRI